MSTPRVIRTVGLVHVVDRRLLVVRSTSKRAFYLPGGKVEPGEAEWQALRRELAEELGVRPVPGSVRFLGRHLAPAYGEGDGVLLDQTRFTATLDGAPTPCAEIAELAWVGRDDYLAQPEHAPALLALLADLDARGLIN